VQKNLIRGREDTPEEQIRLLEECQNYFLAAAEAWERLTSKNYWPQSDEYIVKMGFAHLINAGDAILTRACGDNNIPIDGVDIPNSPLHTQWEILDEFIMRVRDEPDFHVYENVKNGFAMDAAKAARSLVKILLKAQQQIEATINNPESSSDQNVERPKV